MAEQDLFGYLKVFTKTLLKPSSFHMAKSYKISALME